MNERSTGLRLVALTLGVVIAWASAGEAQTASPADRFKVTVGFPGQELQTTVVPGQANASGAPLPAPDDPGLRNLQPAPIPGPTPTPNPPAGPGPAHGQPLDPSPLAEHTNGFEATATVLALPLRDQFNPNNRLPSSFGGATALAMVLEFYGRNLTDNEVADQIGVQDWGCNGDMIARAADTLGFDSDYTPSDVDRLQLEIEGGRPVIVNFTTSEFPGGHWAVVAGFTGDGKVVLHEPAGGVRVEMAVEDFETAWHSPVGNKLAVFVAPRT